MSSSTSGHILVVEDDGDLLEVLKFVLEDEGYRVSTAGSGAEALSIAASDDISLILLDVSMPGTSGIEVAKRLRADLRTSNVRLAVHTGLAAEEVRRQFTDYDAFIEKTEEAGVLVAAVKAAIEQPMRTTTSARPRAEDGIAPEESVPGR